MPVHSLKLRETETGGGKPSLVALLLAEVVWVNTFLYTGFFISFVKKGGKTVTNWVRTGAMSNRTVLV